MEFTIKSNQVEQSHEIESSSRVLEAKTPMAEKNTKTQAYSVVNKTETTHVAREEEKSRNASIISAMNPLGLPFDKLKNQSTALPEKPKVTTIPRRIVHKVPLSPSEQQAEFEEAYGFGFEAFAAPLLEAVTISPPVNNILDSYIAGLNQSTELAIIPESFPAIGIDLEPESEEIIDLEPEESIEVEFLEDEPAASTTEIHIHMTKAQSDRLHADHVERMKAALKEEEATSKLEDSIKNLEHTVAQKALIDATPRISLLTDKTKSTLIDESIVFDESQIRAVDGMVQQRFACLTGAAGTGKTTITKALIHSLQHAVKSVNTAKYWDSKLPPSTDKFGRPILDAPEAAPDDAPDATPKPDNYVPSIVLCAFTGRATQMIKKNFPDSWHGNIMTIHRMLHFVPVMREDLDKDGQVVNKRRFEPQYNKQFKLPWDIIVIDEAGMLSLDLFRQLQEACKPGTRIFFIGDINQLPPVHGDSIFGYAMATYPSFELTHVHRQKGIDNPIVDNAWRILKGEKPEEHPDFTMLKLDSNPMKAGQMLQQAVVILHQKGKFSPETDTAIVAVNGQDMEQRGYWLGQMPNNQALARILNAVPLEKRIFIDAGRTKKEFAVGDKVMVTKNDHEKQITNGMTGFIKEIKRHGHYTGDAMVTGPVDEVNAYMASQKEDTKDMVANIEAMLEMDTLPTTQEFHRGSASHIVTVEFTALGMNDGITVSFDSFSEVDSLQHAYVVTCHKSQGGEYPLVVIAVHDCYSGMMNREWLYTAVTRAAKQVLLLYTDKALNKALRTQSIFGSTLEEKVQKFIQLGKSKYSKVPTLSPPMEIQS